MGRWRVPADVLVPLTLVVGDEELLVGRAVSAVVRAARAADPDVDVRDLVAGELERGDLDDVLSPSLFGERRVLVVRAAQDLGKDVAAELPGLRSRDLPDDVHLVVVHAGGAKGKALLTALAAAEPRRVDAPKVTKFGERRDFVRRELKADGRHVDEEAVAALLEAVGNDLRELSSAAGAAAGRHRRADHGRDGRPLPPRAGRVAPASPSPTGPSTATSPARSSWPAGARAPGWPRCS